MGNSLKVGIFTLTALGLLLLSIAMLGVLEKFQEKAYLMTLVSESVQGLTNGSKVKYKGVPVGKVQDITINTNGRLIRIDMEINLAKFRTKEQQEDDDECISRSQFYEYIHKEIEYGLRSKIEPDGITGQKYIELDFVKNSESEKDSLNVPPPSGKTLYFYVPSVPSIISDLRKSIVSFLEKVEAVDYVGISNKLTQTLHSIDTTLNGPQLKMILNNLEDTTNESKQIARNINKVLHKEAIRNFLDSTQKVTTSMYSLSELLQSEMKKMNISGLSADLRTSMDSLRNSSTQFQESLQKINEAVDAISEFMEYLSEDPSAVIRGKMKPEMKSRIKKESAN